MELLEIIISIAIIAVLIDLLVEIGFRSPK